MIRIDRENISNTVKECASEALRILTALSMIPQGWFGVIEPVSAMEKGAADPCHTSTHTTRYTDIAYARGEERDSVPPSVILCRILSGSGEFSHQKGESGDKNTALRQYVGKTVYLHHKLLGGGGIRDLMVFTGVEGNWNMTDPQASRTIVFMVISDKPSAASRAETTFHVVLYPGGTVASFDFNDPPRQITFKEAVRVE